VSIFIEFHGAFSLKVVTVSIFIEIHGLIFGEEIKSQNYDVKLV